MIEKYFITIAFILMSSISLYGQDSSLNRKNKNAFTIEVAGHSRGLISVNYERMFFTPVKYIFYGVRTGVGYVPGMNIRDKRHKGTVTVPLVFSLLVGKKKSYVQLSLGYASSFGHDFIDSTTTTPTVYQKFESVYTIGLGYRFIWNDFVAQAYPMLQLTSNYYSRFSVGFGVSIGSTF